MNEKVAIAIIAASSGIVGALVGGIASIVGPWFLKRLDYRKEDKESRRKVLVKFCHAQMDSISEMHQVFQFGKPIDKFAILSREANNLTTELYSMIPKDEAKVKDWINDLLFRARSSKPRDLEELTAVDLFVSFGTQKLLSWHTGQLSAESLKPFGLDKNQKPIQLNSWNDAWPLYENA